MGVVDEEIRRNDIERLKVVRQRHIPAKDRHDSAEIDFLSTERHDKFLHKVIEDSSVGVACELHEHPVSASVQLLLMELENVDCSEALGVVLAKMSRCWESQLRIRRDLKNAH